MTTETDLSSSFDDQSTMTPPPMNGRVGRIHMPSCSPSITESSRGNGIERDDETSLTDFQRRHNVRRSLKYSKKDEETDDRTELLISALNQLQRLAILGSTEYQQRLIENNLPTLQIQQTNALHIPNLVKNPASTQISELPQPIKTPLVQLSMSIHRLHSAVVNITREVDGHTDEVRELQSQLEVLRRRNTQVESAAKKVHKKNLRLKQEAQRDRKMAHELKQKVRQCEAQLESLGFELMANKVQNHEIHLQHSKTTKHNFAGSEEEGDNSVEPRERINSSMSDFTDIDQQSLGDDCSESVKTSEVELNGEQKSPNAEVHRTPSGSSLRAYSDLSERAGEHKKANAGFAVSPVSSEMSQKSHSVIDDTLPTLRYSAKGTLKGDRKTTRPNSNKDSSDITISSGLDGFNPSSKKESKPTEVQPQVESIKKAEKGTNAASLSNRFAKFLGTRPIPNYNLKIITPCNIQFVKLPLNAAQVLDKETVRKSQKFPCAFVICGLDGFDDAINMKPTIGARLTKINGKAIDEQWTIEKLYYALDKKDDSGTENRTRRINLTFRNETWDAVQTRILDSAIQRIHVHGASVGSDGENGGKQRKNDGTSLFESQSRQTNGSPQRSDGETPSKPFQRARTASADSVGKAISGIGNFLQKINPSEEES